VLDSCPQAIGVYILGWAAKKVAASIEVRWPSGVLQTLREVHADQILKLEEPD